MSSSSGKSNDVPSSWDAYWRGTDDAAAFSHGGVQHPYIETFWRDYFTGIKRSLDAPRMLDIAGGNGALFESARAAFAGEAFEFNCLDISQSAIDGLQKRYPDVKGIVCDARKIPLESASFDVVTSQFGVEYAGIDAIYEAARLVTAGGSFALLLHHRGGSIEAECRASLEAILKLRKVAFIPRALRMFEAGFAALRGASPATLAAAEQQMQPAFKVMQKVLNKHGRQVAGNTIDKLCQEVIQIHGRMKHYEQREVLGWLRSMQQELEAYEGRMKSMFGAAIEQKTFDRVCAELETRGFEIARRSALTPPGAALPLAFAVIANQPSQ